MQTGMMAAMSTYPIMHLRFSEVILCFTVRRVILFPACGIPEANVPLFGFLSTASCTSKVLRKMLILLVQLKPPWMGKEVSSPLNKLD